MEHMDDTPDTKDKGGMPSKTDGPTPAAPTTPGQAHAGAEKAPATAVKPAIKLKPKPARKAAPKLAAKPAPKAKPVTAEKNDAKGRRAADKEKGGTRKEADVLAALAHLRTVIRETAKAYIANVERDILEIGDQIASHRGKRGSGKALKDSALEEMGRILHGLTFKPHKGRRSDLKKVEKALDGLSRLVR